MKLLLFSLIALSTTFADASVKTVLQHRMSIGFGPQSVLGTYYVRVMETGEVRCIDNAGAMKRPGFVELAEVETARRILDGLRSGKLVATSTGPGCMDAPLVVNSGFTSAGKEIVFWKFDKCIESVRKDAKELVRLMKKANVLCSEAN